MAVENDAVRHRLLIFIDNPSTSFQQSKTRMVTVMKYRSTYSMNPETPLVLPVLLLAILLAILSLPAQGAAETTDFDWQETFSTAAAGGTGPYGGKPGE